MSQPEIGLIGLGTMGAALALNIAEKGFPIAVWNRTADVTHKFHATAGALADRITPTDGIEDFVAAMKPPRSIILMVPAGPVVDAQIAALRPLLGPDDLIIDAGNANFHDTNTRAALAKAEGFGFMGIGVSGGEEGARHGPAIMAGGTARDWARMAPVLQAIAARHGDEPCADHMGPDGAGHFVKMVHNGIEYADMQMIAEIYALQRDGLGMTAPQIGDVYAGWNDGKLNSYLIEISAAVARAVDPVSGAAMLDVILDAAGQKGTGRWTAIEAQHLASPVPVIEAAVVARNVSSRVEERARGASVFGDAPQRMAEIDMTTLESALIAGKILCYAQGFEMLAAAARDFGWDLPMANVARVWRAGCIIRSAMLEDMANALEAAPQDNLIFAPAFAEMLKASHADLRRVVVAAVNAGIAVPALSGGLAWFDAMRTKRTPANMIQGQRDFFGAHGYLRLDGKEAPHGPWAMNAS